MSPQQKSNIGKKRQPSNREILSRPGSLTNVVDTKTNEDYVEKKISGDSGAKPTDSPPSKPLLTDETPCGAELLASGRWRREPDKERTIVTDMVKPTGPNQPPPRLLGL